MYPVGVDLPDPEAANVAAEFPGWKIERGLDGLLYAQLVGSHPPLVVRGEDAAELRGQIRTTT